MSFKYHRTVRFHDTDAAGVVYFANLLTICHEAYEESLAASGINIKTFFTNPSVAFPIIHAGIDFFQPLFCGDKLVISLYVQKINDDKFEINYEIFVHEMVAAKAITRHVCIDSSSRKKINLPAEIKQWLEINHRNKEKNERIKSREVM